MTARPTDPPVAEPSSAEAAAPAAPAHAVPPAILPSTALLRGQKAVTIAHNGAVYRLQTTRQGKLILTK